jgi:hypothetical protein
MILSGQGIDEYGVRSRTSAPVLQGWCVLPKKYPYSAPLAEPVDFIPCHLVREEQTTRV